LEKIACFGLQFAGVFPGDWECCLKQESREKVLLRTIAFSFPKNIKNENEDLMKTCFLEPKIGGPSIRRGKFPEMPV